MTIGELVGRTRSGGVARAELVAARRGAGSVHFAGTCDFTRGVTILERQAPDLLPLWVELVGDEVARTAGGEPEQRVVDATWAGRDVGRSAAGLLGLLEAASHEELGAPGTAVEVRAAPAPWAGAVAVQVTGIALPGGPRSPVVRVTADDQGRLSTLEVVGRRLAGRPRVTHRLRLHDWRERER